MLKVYFFVHVLLSFLFGQPEFHQYTHGGIERDYILYRPECAQNQSPLIFVFHGYTGTANGIMEYSNMNSIADTNCFTVCYPQGIVDDYNNTFFNVGYSFHWNESVDDVGFIISLAEYLQNEYNLSTINTFTTGMSNGGDFSYLLSCQESTKFKAAAPIAGVMMEWIFNTCVPESPIPILEIHGTNDNVSWWNGDIEDSGGWGPYMDVDTTIQFWSEINLCSHIEIDTLNDMNTQDGSYVITEKYTQGIMNHEVWLYKIVNGGHDWPGAWGNMDIIASEVIWQFFDHFKLDYSIGDIDYNGSIDVIDLLIISDGVIENSYFNFISDFNNDNINDINDIYALLTFILGY